jgi:hypothetical protein
MAVDSILNTKRRFGRFGGRKETSSRHILFQGGVL